MVRAVSNVHTQTFKGVITMNVKEWRSYCRKGYLKEVEDYIGDSEFLQVYEISDLYHNYKDAFVDSFWEDYLEAWWLV